MPIDGADQGKHKLFDGIHTYAELSFVEDGGGGGATPGGNNGDLQVKNGSNFDGLANAAANFNFTPFVYLNAGSFPGAYQATGLTGDNEPWYKLEGAAGPIDDGNNSILYQGYNVWEISNATGLVMYQGTGADLLTATWTNTGDGALPLPSLVGIEATQVQAAVEEVAGEVAAIPRYLEMRVELSDLGNPSPAIDGGYNELGSGYVVTASGNGDYRITFDSAVLPQYLTSPEAFSADTSTPFHVIAVWNSTTRVDIKAWDNASAPSDPSKIVVVVRVKQ